MPFKCQNSIYFVQTVKCQNSSILNNSVKHKYRFNVKNSSISNTSVQHKYTVSLSKTFLFQAIQFIQKVLIQTIQFSISSQFSFILPIHRTLSGATTPGKVDLGAMTMKGCFTFPKASASLELHHQIVQYHIEDTRWGQRSSRFILQPQPIGQSSTIVEQIN